MAVHLPLLPLEALRPRWCEPAPRVVLEQTRVVVASALAAAAGVRAGMRRGGVQSLCPAAQLLERDPGREQAALRETALALLRYTPEVALAEENSLLLNVGASLSAFGGARALCRRVGADVTALGFGARIGLAPTAQGAWLLARHAGDGRRRTLGAAAMTRRLDALPLTVLPPARAHADWLHGIGCRHLGELRRLPGAGLRRRCGVAVSQALARAYGEAAELHRWVEAPPNFSAGLELPQAVEQAEMLLFAARRLLLQLCGWLSARQRAAARFTLLLEHPRGYGVHAARPRHGTVEIALAEPAWQEEHMLRLLRERLARTALAAPVTGLRLEAVDTLPWAPASAALFPEPGGTPADYRRLLELLTARLGDEAVLTPAPLADHRPETRNRWRPAGTGTIAASAPAPAAERPFWLLERPLALAMSGHRPCYGTPLTLLRGPERIEAGWWDQALALRDYFIAEDAAAVRYWIYRERQAGRAQWFLHGLFA